jgi:hypothetical protein
VNKADVGKALMMVGGCLAITLLAALLLVMYGETASPGKVTGLFAAQLAMWPVFLVGFHLRFSNGNPRRKPAGEEMRLHAFPRAFPIMSQGIFHPHRK